jgi:hypothetical protein
MTTNTIATKFAATNVYFSTYYYVKGLALCKNVEIHNVFQVPVVELYHALLKIQTIPKPSSVFTIDDW